MAVALAALGGGLRATVWYPAALLALALLAVGLAVSPPRRSPGRLVAVGLVAYGAFVAWSYASMLWAANPADAWEGSNRALFFGLVLGVVVLRPWSRRAATAALGIVAFGIVAVAIGILVTGVVDPSVDLYEEGRLAQPGDYPNAAANLWLLGLWPAVFIASARGAPRFARTLAVAAATVLLQMLLLTQSRGALISLVASGIVFIVLTPRRWFATLLLCAAALATAPILDTLLAVRDSAGVEDLARALDDAAVAIGASAALAMLLGGLLIALDQTAGAMLARDSRIRRAGRLAAAAVTIGALVAVLVAIGNPRQWVEERWDEFKSPSYSRVESGRTRFTGGLESGRYDFYRVAIDEFAEAPLAGIGTDNFAAAYLQRRRTDEAPRHPHSLAMQVMSELGLIGTVLLAVALTALVVSAVRARRAATGDEALLVAAAVSGFAAFLVHAQIDWIWQFTGLGALAFVLLGIAAGLGAGDRGAAARSGPRAPAGARWIPLAALPLAVGLAVPGLAARYKASAYPGYRADPAAALERLDRAADLNPLDSEPLVAAGVIERRLGHPARAARLLREALSRFPDDWFAHLELGVVESRLGDTASARRSIGRARELNPRDPFVETATAAVRERYPVDLGFAEREFGARLGDRLIRRERSGPGDRRSE